MIAPASSSPLRILLVLPMSGGSLPIGHYCAEALRDLGHTVDSFDAPAYHAAFEALRGLRVSMERKEHLETGFLNVIGQAIHARVEHFEPDLVLAMAQAPLGRNILQRLQRDNVPTAMWFVEDFRVFTYWRAFAPLYDAFFVIQKEPFLSELRAVGLNNAAYLPLAALPSFHKPCKVSQDAQQRFGSALSFLGAGYPNRRVAFRQLLSYDFKIWGSDWDGEAMLQQCIQENGRRIAPEEAVQIFNASAINLNLHSSVQAKQLVAPGDFVNPRTFELAACGAFQLVDERALMPELFELTGDNAELATFTDMHTLQDAIQHYLAHPEERRLLALRARARVLQQHTYQRRMSTLLEHMAVFQASAARPWPRVRAQSALPHDLPEDLRTQLTALLDRLQLPADSAFEDVITRLRSESGELSGMETALLFLDEWKKHYRK